MGNLQFVHKHVSNDFHKDCWVVKAVYNESVLPIITLHDGKEMYEHGLQMNFKDLVAMQFVAQAIASTLQAYHDAGKGGIIRLNKEVYDKTIDLYKPFISKSMSYDVVDAQVKLYQEWDKTS